MERKANWPMTILLLAIAFAIVVTFGSYMAHIDDDEEVSIITPPVSLPR